MSIPDEIQRAILDHTIDLHRVEAGLRIKIQRMLNQLASELAADIVDSGLDTPRTGWRRARLQALMRAVEDKISGTYSDIRDVAATDLAGLAQITADGVIQAVNEAIGADLLMPVRWTPEYLARLAGETLIEGAPSAEWWGRQAAGFRDDFLDQMRQGLLRGESITELRDRIVPKKDLRLKANAPEASAIRKARRGAEALVRTSALSVTSQAHLDAYEANADILAGVTWMATLDSRSCLVAGSPVEVPSGESTIESLKEGDLVIGGSGETRKVTGVMTRKAETTLKITLSNGEVVRCTPDHLWLLPDQEWVAAGSLKAGDPLASRLN